MSLRTVIFAYLSFSQMRKLTMEELGRLSKTAYPASANTRITIVLDNIRSLHNVGSVFRSADGFGIHTLYLCGYTGCPPHAEIRKTALGADETVTWAYHKDITALLHILKEEGYYIVALEQTEGSIRLPEFKMEADKSYAFILGNEVEGVQQAALNLCDASVEIPQFGSKHSLNVSVAAGILMYALSNPE